MVRLHLELEIAVTLNSNPKSLDNVPTLYVLLAFPSTTTINLKISFVIETLDLDPEPKLYNLYGFITVPSAKL